MKKLISSLLFLSCLTPLGAVDIESKMYIDSSELDMTDDRFHIHVGDNQWIETTSVVHDQTGLYTLESNILKKNTNCFSEYEKKWKCPYCFQRWPMGKSCKNPECPGNFTDAARVK